MIDKNDETSSEAKRLDTKWFLLKMELTTIQLAEVNEELSDGELKRDAELTKSLLNTRNELADLVGIDKYKV